MFFRPGRPINIESDSALHSEKRCRAMAGALNPATYWQNPAAFANNFTQCFNFTAQGLAVARDVRATFAVPHSLLYARHSRPVHSHARVLADLRVFRW